MADAQIRQEFIDGVQEVYTTLLTSGSEGDGVYYYAQSGTNNINVYGENRYKHFLPPVLLMCKATLTPTHGEEAVEGIKDSAVFNVPVGSFIECGLSTDHSALDIMRRGMFKFHDVWYQIDNVSPTVFVEDTFLIYKFDCTEYKEFDEEFVIIDEPPGEESGDPDELPVEGDADE